MDTAITGHTFSRGGAQAPPHRFPRFANPSLSNLLVVGADAGDRLRVAREFHESGRLRGGPLVVASACAENWTEIFFRALSGQAGVNRFGPLVAAEGGTLFLDEVDSLDRDAQRLMLEFLKRGRSRGARDSGWAGLLAVGASEDLGWLASRGLFLPALFDSLDKIRVNLDLVA